VKLFPAGGISSIEKESAMIRRDYLQEIGLDPVEKTVPWPYVLAILVILLAGVEWFAGWKMKSHRPPLPQMAQSAMVTHKPAYPATPLNAPAKTGLGTSRHGVT
jgi:hypothetical protein